MVLDEERSLRAELARLRARLGNTRRKAKTAHGKCATRLPDMIAQTQASLSALPVKHDAPWLVSGGARRRGGELL